MNSPSLADQLIIAVSPIERTIASVTIQLIIAGPAVQRGVEAVIGRQHVIAVPAVERAVLSKRTEERVVELRADEVLDAHERIDPGSPCVLWCVPQIEIDRDPCRRRAVGGGIAPGPSVQQVIAIPAREHVIAGIAEEHVVEPRASEVLNTHELVDAAPPGVLRSRQIKVDRDARRRTACRRRCRSRFPHLAGHCRSRR